MTVNVHEAKTHYSRLLERAHAGEEIVLGKAGKPYARMVPLADPADRPARKPGGLDFVLSDAFFDPLPEDELRLWEGG